MRVTLLWLLFLVSQFTFAQEKTISGVVSDESGGLPGVSIIIKGTTTGVETDFDGNYSINAKQNDILIFSFVGKATTRKTVGASNKINVVLADDENLLNEIVVTALGIKREKQALGYATQQVKSKDIEEKTAGETNIANGLRGVTTGVSIISSSGDVGSPTSVVIRGISSLNGSNQALFVVDGVPISNGSADLGNISGVNRAADIDPNNVESMSILRGGAATALYGERGANGVILITTKKGKNSDKLGINISSTYTISKANIFPEFQTEYARGAADGKYTASHNSWGPAYSTNPKFPEGTDYEDMDADGINDDVSGQPIPYFANNYERFFNTGTTSSNNISVNSGSEKSSFFASYTNLDQKGIVPNASLKRNSVTLNSTFNVNDQFTVGGSANYINSKTSKTASGWEGWGQGIGYYHHMWDIKRPWKTPQNTKSFFSGSVKDPNWAVNENNQKSVVNRVYGNVFAAYEISDWLNFSYKIGIDTYSEAASRYQPFSDVNTSQKLGDGYEYSSSLYDINSLFLITGAGDFSEKIGISYTFGHNHFESQFKSLQINASNQETRYLQALIAFKTFTPFANTINTRDYGVFGDVTLDYNNTFYLGFTGRNDWTSKLSSENNSFFYPSVNASLIFSKLIGKNNILNYGKLRSSYVKVGKTGPAYLLYDQFSKANQGNQVAGLTGAYQANTKFNKDLVPEISTEWEVGLEAKFLDNKIGFDFTYYNKLSEDQILRVASASSTGFNGAWINSGAIRNSGYEVQLTLNDLIKISDDFSWNINFNFTKNKGVVESLPEEFSDGIALGGNAWTNVSRYYKAGYSTGIIQGDGYELDAKGNILVDDKGQPNVIGGQIVGDVNPDWNLGINTNLNYKSFNLSFLFDIKKGGDIVNDTQGSWMYSGMAKRTENRYYGDGSNPNANATTIVKGVNKNTGLVNDVAIPLTRDFWRNTISRNGSELVQDASWVRLRNVALTYKLPKKHLKTVGIDNLQFSIIGSNLWLYTNYDGQDPEVSSAGTGRASGFDVSSAPQTKNYSFNVKFGF
ncbi:SusC/RagA family TonB-linked outer membrane protein [Tenacibaculum finnmarkense]|uniref:SusC/RagA family TonB-linked outer membrane protein n=1 Tax=Tenacibaculum finnmarkense TaxID=2781243 RepID=UPI001E3D807C|nr:SusC/RagA family TonB-linked outer membrane protein [Tenacibaculum finnmarkense]MCD8399072.1 SusC/RagA family TonB-linked outer membrane protein [Tenacibaculum finnmarkense genomovar ulcerans]MCG8748450.1 SusC/RagA family TonB-linked outer membrane protein [Tenacibaculum finnmarkense]